MHVRGVDPVTTVWWVPRRGWRRQPPGIQRSREYIEQSIANSRQWWSSSWATGWENTRRNKRPEFNGLLRRAYGQVPSCDHGRGFYKRRINPWLRDYRLHGDSTPWNWWFTLKSKVLDFTCCIECHKMVKVSRQKPQRKDDTPLPVRGTAAQLNAWSQRYTDGHNTVCYWYSYSYRTPNITAQSSTTGLQHYLLVERSQLS